MKSNELRRDPSLLLHDVRVPMTHDEPRASPPEPHVQEEQPRRSWWKFCYDRDRRTFCDRSCLGWLNIIIYSVLYIIFLSTYTMVLLYLSLWYIKSKEIYLYTESLLDSGSEILGLTVTPTAVNKMSLIWYEESEPRSYEKYVSAYHELLAKRNSAANEQLGPCGKTPYGYGQTPCVIVRINKHHGSEAIALTPPDLNSSDIPAHVKSWAKTDSKLWLHCSGTHAYDTEHIGSIKYYPDPPGFPPGSYIPSNDSRVNLVAVQFTNFSKAIALSVECSIFYKGGKSVAQFVLYVTNSR